MASTYSNLSIELIGTGDQSGTWGTTTNTNLGTALEEAIVGTVNQAVTAVDLTLPWSTASNATQVARHSRLNLTGSSGGASNLIVPTLSGGKNYYIKNSSTTAITVKTAAGTGILVPAGNAMSLYQDGTNVVEAADYSTSYTIGTLTTTNDATVNGLTVGKGANSVATNTALGVSALSSGSLSGTMYTAVGASALKDNTTGGSNIAIGNSALQLNTTGSSNTGIGYLALLNNTTGVNNTAIGQQTLASNVSGSSNAAFGSIALANSTAGNNTAIGQGSMYLTTTGGSNSALGWQSLYNNTTGD
jgi:trimeric autotransporter adhesin